MSDSLYASEAIHYQPNESAPINRLPLEIPNYIFSLCIGEEEDRFDKCIILLRLTWVCQLWRHAIINNTSFWTTVDYSNKPELVATFIRRSRERKLRIELWDSAFECPQNVAVIKSTLISEAARIEYIEAELSSWNLKSIKEVLCRPFPSLRHLSFCRECDDDKLPLINSHVPFTLDISKLEIFDLDHSSSVPWNCLQAVISKVRKLRINFNRLESVVKFFDNIQSSNGLEILFISCELQGLPQIPTVTLPNLTAILIRDRVLSTGSPQVNHHPLASFLANHLRVPNLRHLVIADCNGYTSIFHPDFDYASIQYISLIVIMPTWPTGSYSFCITGSAKKDKLRNDWLRPPYESFLSESSLDKQFQLMVPYFRQEAAGIIKSFAVLNELIPKMPGVLELCLPSSPFLNARLCHNLLHPKLMIHYPSLTGFQRIRSTSDMHVYGR